MMERTGLLVPQTDLASPLQQFVDPAPAPAPAPEQDEYFQREGLVYRPDEKMWVKPDPLIAPPPAAPPQITDDQLQLLAKQRGTLAPQAWESGAGAALPTAVTAVKKAQAAPPAPRPIKITPVDHAPEFHVELKPVDYTPDFVPEPAQMKQALGGQQLAPQAVDTGLGVVGKHLVQGYADYFDPFTKGDDGKYVADTAAAMTPNAQGKLPEVMKDQTLNGLMLGLDVGSNFVGGSGAATKAIMAGVGARLAPLGKLVKAEAFEAARMQPEAIRQATGWFRGADNAWRFEIPDTEARFVHGVAQARKQLLEQQAADLYKQRDAVFDVVSGASTDQALTNQLNAKINELYRQIDEPLRMKDIIHHPELMANYPHIGEMPVEIKDLGGAVRGQQIPGVKADPNLPWDDLAARPGKIELDTESGTNRLTALHEIQHEVQDVEKFARGGSYSTPEVAQEATAATGVRRSELIAQMQTLIDERDAWIAGEMKKIDFTGKLDKHEQLDMAESFWATHPDAAKKLNELEASTMQLNAAHQRALHQAYKNLAGEVESRVVEKRAGMTPRELERRPPIEDEDVPRDKQIVVRRADDANATTRVTETPEFKNWFGDSKVVDESGQPLVVYHTTTSAGEFTSFKRKRNDLGVHFGTQGQARDRFELKSEKDPYGSQLRGVSHGTIPAYLSIKNPLRLRDAGMFDHHNLPGALEAAGIPTAEIDAAMRGKRHSPSGQVAALRDLIESNGYDGVVYANTGETGGGAIHRQAVDKARAALNGKSSFSVEEQATPEYQAYKKAMEGYRAFREGNAEDSYIAFRPTQIKSATGNSGKFDPKNPDIRASIDDDRGGFANRGLQEFPDEIEGGYGRVRPESAGPESPPKATPAPAVQPRGAGGGSGLEEAQRAAADAAGSARPLQGLPQEPLIIRGKHYFPGPIEEIHNIAADYMKSAGREYKPLTSYVPVEPKRATRIASEYAKMPHAPNDPAVKASYDAMINETIDQLKVMQKSVKIEFIKPGQVDPYAETPRLAAIDVRDNKHLWVYPTDSGFGSGAEASAAELADNPLLRKTGINIDGRELLANDAFRIVHDFFGHLKDGVGFRAGGEENAWRSHMRMYSPKARPAMTSETRGQNSWLNYGPHGAKNHKAKSSDTIYADQKTGIMPNWTHLDGYADAPMPQLAERYPEVAPPSLQTDKKSGKQFLGKELSPEAVEMGKHRREAQREIDAGNYTPYFEPSERFDVDPKNYPTKVDTTKITGAKPATVEKYRGFAESRDATKRLDTAYKAGVKIGGGDRWYQMGQLEKEFIDELGEEAGREAFKQRFGISMAATTGGASPTDNLIMSHYGNHLRAKGLPYPEAAHEAPYPVGGRFITGNMEQHKKMLDAGDIGEANPKRHNFAYNFMGHRDKATLDEQMSDLFKPGMTQPPPGNYGTYETGLHKRAKKANVDPVEFQEVAWAGHKSASDPKYKPGPMIQTVNEAIERTHRITGMPKKEIVRRGLIRGEIPLYGAAGLITGGAAIGSGSQLTDGLKEFVD